MTATSKDTIYVDVDEEITGIVSKVQNSPKDIGGLGSAKTSKRPSVDSQHEAAQARCRGKR